MTDLREELAKISFTALINLAMKSEPDDRKEPAPNWDDHDANVWIMQDVCRAIADAFLHYITAPKSKNGLGMKIVERHSFAPFDTLHPAECFDAAPSHPGAEGENQ